MALRVPDKGEKFGPVEVDRSGKVVRILEDGPTQLNTDVRMFCGIHILESKFLELLKPEGFSCVVRRGYLEALRRGCMVQSYICTKVISPTQVRLDAFWTLTGTHFFQSILLGQVMALHKQEEIHGGLSRIEFGAGVELGDRVSIGQGARVGEVWAYLEDTLIERGAVVRSGERLVGVIRLTSGATAIR